jgi:hypothetical protein
MELLLELGVVQAGSPRFDHHREIHPRGGDCTVNPKTLTNPTFYAISTDGISDFATDAYAQT